VKRRDFIGLLAGSLAAPLCGAQARPRMNVSMTIESARWISYDDVVEDLVPALREWLSTPFSDTPDGGQP